MQLWPPLLCDLPILSQTPPPLTFGANLSHPTCILIAMSTFNTEPTPAEIFADPVSYLASFGIEAEVISETEPQLPVAA